MTEMFARLQGQSRRPVPPGGDWVPLLPVPADAPPPPAGHPKNGRPSAQYAYRASSGELLGIVHRFEQEGGKIYQPLTFCRHSDHGRREWRWKGWQEPRPLYGLDRLAARPEAPVIVCEGERAADAASRLLPGCVALTSPNGSKSAGKAGWGPLAGRSVTIWPDADQPGADYAQAVSRALRGVAAASIAILEPPTGVKAGWDAADAEAEGWDEARALALVASARPVEGGGPAEGADDGTEGGSRRRGTAARDGLLDLMAEAEFWHSPDREPYVSIPVNGHIEHLLIKSEPFREWLIGEYFTRCRQVPTDQSLKDAVAVMAARAVHDGPTYPVFLRVGSQDGALWLDLGDATWRAVRITADCWQMVDRPPVKFRRPGAMRPLPEPRPEATVDELRELLNVATEGDFTLAVAWLVAAFNPDIACPILAVNGEQCSAKSTISTLLRQLVDPNEAPIRAAPRDEQDFIVASHNSRVVVLDNLSDIPGWLSDALCRVTTGGGFATRKLFSDRDEVVFFIKRPIILNGIPDLASRPDLADRCLMLTLPAIPEAERKTEAEFWATFEQRSPYILGAILDAVSGALRRLPSTRLDSLPRMADFALWGTAAEEALDWAPGQLIQAYTANRAGAVEKTIEADPVADAVCKVAAEADWEGPATALLAELAKHVPDSMTRSRLWPHANKLKSRLRRLQAPLRAMGIVVDLEHRAATKDRTRLISIRRPNRWTTTPPETVEPDHGDIA